MTAVTPPARYGAIEMDGDLVRHFKEKPPGDNAFINGGFFVLNPSVLNRIESDATHWELAPLEGLARESCCDLSATADRGLPPPAVATVGSTWLPLRTKMGTNCCAGGSLRLASSVAAGAAIEHADGEDPLEEPAPAD